MLALLITIGVSVVVAGVAAGLTARSRNARPLVMGIGLTALPIGLFLSGVTQLTINGIESLIDWFARTQMTSTIGWGIGLAVAGLVLAVGGAFLPKGSKQVRPKPEPGALPKQERPQVASQSSATPKAAKQAKAPNQQKGLDAEDAEIEALLRRRGIM